MRPNCSRLIEPSLPPCTTIAAASKPGEVEPDPRRVSSALQCSLGCSCRDVRRTRVERDRGVPRFVRPSHLALPVAIMSPVFASITAPARPQIAEPLSSHELGSIRARRSLHSEFHT